MHCIHTSQLISFSRSSPQFPVILYKVYLSSSIIIFCRFAPNKRWHIDTVLKLLTTVSVYQDSGRNRKIRNRLNLPMFAENSQFCSSFEVNSMM